MSIEINDLEHKNLIHSLDDTKLELLVGGILIGGSGFLIGTEWILWDDTSWIISERFIPSLKFNGYVPLKANG
jgi:hypothetical protein